MHPINPILLVDDEEMALNSYKFQLLADGFDNIKSFTKGEDTLHFLEKHNASTMLLDLMMPGISGREVLQTVSEKYPQVPVVIITATGEVDTVVECMKHGAFDFISKPVEPVRLITAVKHAIAFSDLRNENLVLTEHVIRKDLQHPEVFKDIITQNPEMLAIFNYIEAIATSNQPVLITGETGTGKEMISKAVHVASEKKGDFVALNVAGLDDNIFSDTLFGHEKGAYTGADKKRHGLIDQASGGTILLDEIGDLSMNSQLKLLRLIQENEYFSLGADNPQFSDARILVATNKSLDYLKNPESFRNDLYYRLCAHHIHIPPLRERMDDLPILINSFLENAYQEFGRKPFKISPDIYDALSYHHFPGNIRELKSIIYDAVSVSKTNDSLSEYFIKFTSPQNRTTYRGSAGEETQNQNSDIQNPYELFKTIPTMNDAENLLIKETLKRTKGNRSSAAQILGITRQTLHRKLKQIDI